MTVAEKKCPKCGETKAATQFYVSKNRPDGLSSYCRQCQVTDSKSRYSSHPRWRAPEGKKYCPGCQTIKDLEAFGSNRASHDGKQQYCKPCAVARVTASRKKDPTSHRRSSKNWREANLEQHKDAHARRTYGLASGTYARMFEAQKGLCAICEAPPLEGKRFHIDHCHDTGAIRGLLCSCCNTGIGQLKHSVDLLNKAQAYLLLGTYPLTEGRGIGGHAFDTRHEHDV